MSSSHFWAVSPDAMQPPVLLQDNYKSTQNITGQVQISIFQIQVPWLVVFDNLKDPFYLHKFLPCVMTLHLNNAIAGGNSDCTINLRNFDPSESLRLLLCIALMSLLQ